jgi:hypothetical protein
MPHDTKQAYAGQPGTVTGVLATVPGGAKWASVQVLLSNESGNDATVTLGKNGSGAGTRFIPTVLIPANTVETLDLGDGLVLIAGDTIDGYQGTSGAMTVFIGVIEETP